MPGWQAGSVASGQMVRSDMPKEQSSVAGFVCLPCGSAVAIGVRCVCDVNRGRRVLVQGSGIRPGCGWCRLAMPGATGLAWRDWIGLPGAAGRIICQSADGAFGDAERPVIDGGICVSAMRQRCCPWGEVRFGSPRATGVCLGQRDPSGVRLVPVGNAGGCGVAGLAGRLV